MAAHNAKERAMGWFSYLEEQLHFPDSGKCIAQRATWPWRKGHEVHVVDLAPAEEGEHEMLVTIT